MNNMKLLNKDTVKYLIRKEVPTPDFYWCDTVKQTTMVKKITNKPILTVVFEPDMIILREKVGFPIIVVTKTEIKYCYLSWYKTYLVEEVWKRLYRRLCDYVNFVPQSKELPNYVNNNPTFNKDKLKRGTFVEMYILNDCSISFDNPDEAIKYNENWCNGLSTIPGIVKEIDSDGQTLAILYIYEDKTGHILPGCILIPVQDIIDGNVALNIISVEKRV